MEYRFWPEIRPKNQDGTLGSMLPVRPSKVHNLLQNNHKYVRYQDDIFLPYNSLAGTIQVGTKGINILKYFYMIGKKHWKELKK